MQGRDRKIIAAVTSWEDVENLNLVLDQLILAAEGTDYLPLCVAFDRGTIHARGEAGIREFMQAFEIENLAGFVLFGEMIRSDEINRRLIRLAHDRRLPVFMLERQYEGCVNLSLGYGAGFEKLARHMVEDHGCRDVVMVAGLRGNAYSEERVAICRRVLERNGGALPPEQVIYGEFWDAPTTRALEDYFAGGGHMPEAFICANDAMAIAVCIYLAERDVQVPEQVRVAGFDGIFQGENHDPTITTARPDYRKLFERMLGRVAAWRGEESGVTEVWSVPFELRLQESCGCARGDPFENIKKVSKLKYLNLTYTRHIREMGNFVRKTLNINAVEKLAERLPPVFANWPGPYHFAAVLDEEAPGLARPILHGVHGRFDTGAVFSWEESPLPDVAALRRDPSVRIVLAQLLQNEEETMGYLVSGMDKWNLWEQERFEEHALFLSSALNAVVGNRRLERANRAILQLAEHDYLTGLYNRRGFLRELERILLLPEAQGSTLTLFAMDMDGLKGINDAYGHHEGDYAIQCLARAIREETQGRGICARYGGDEFAFALLADRACLNELEAIRARVEAAACGFCGPRAYRIRASLGACARPVAERASLDVLLAEADHALYADKQRRKAARPEKA